MSLNSQTSPLNRIKSMRKIKIGSPQYIYMRKGALARRSALTLTHDNKLRVPVTAFNKQDKKGETPLFYAVRENRLDTVEFLAARKVDVNHRSRELMTPVGIAIENNSLPTIRLLLSKGADLDNSIGLNHESPLHLSVKKEHDEITFFLLSQGADVSKKDQNGVQPIHLAASGGKRDLVRLFIACGADPLPG